MLLLVVAGMAAMHPVEPIPTHVAASASARPGFYLRSLHAVSPTGDLTDPPPAFRWRANGGPGAVAFVLCEADYTEIDRIAGIDGDVLVTPEALRDRLAARGTFHWFVEAEASGRTVRSRLASFTIR
ncbi:MAG: hypothetical protein JNL08_19735 [Planctomycetes bacterium]|nr:hypothetical protein [Planctomycetota bacterium]